MKQADFFQQVMHIRIGPWVYREEVSAGDNNVKKHLAKVPLFLAACWSCSFTSPSIAEGTNEGTPTASQVDNVKTQTGTTANEAPPVQLQPVAKVSPDLVLPGPLNTERKNLYAQIQAASKRGVGISGYMSAFNSIEESVKQGQPADKISPQVKRLTDALSSQKQMVHQSRKGSVQGQRNNAKSEQDAAIQEGINDAIKDALGGH